MLTRVGKAYVVMSDGERLQYRFKPLDRPDWYVAEVSGDSAEGTTRLYAVLRVDLSSGLAETYKSVAGPSYAGPGLRACGDGAICIDDLDAYVARAWADIDAGAAADVTYLITVQ